MANPKIFCNVPWTNLHIYWDGSYGGCCSESSPPYPPDQAAHYNLKTQSVVQWYNSDVMKAMRKSMLSDTPLPGCSQCYYEEAHGHESRRIKENFKSAIFTKQAFEPSYEQSGWHSRFESALTDGDQAAPIDWHVDLGNECNLACKMCYPRASSKIAAQYRKWGIPVLENRNWVNDDQSWESFMKNLSLTPVNRVHFMGGEPTVSKKFVKIIDELISTNQTDLSVSFVTNGTNLNQELIDKLKRFKSVDIEVSLEAFNKTNDYIRQGSSWQDIVSRIESAVQQQTDCLRVILRSVPQLLNINTYHEYIARAWEYQLAVQSIPLSTPDYLQISVLPDHLRQRLIPNFEKVKQQIQERADQTHISMVTGRDPTRLHMSLVNECDMIIQLLLAPRPDNVADLEQELAQWLSRWDREYRLNAFDYYPEYTEFLTSIGYEAL